MYSLRFIVALSLLLGCLILVVDIRPSLAMPIEGDNESEGSGDDHVDDDDDDDDKSEHSFTDEDGSDVTLTDTDVKEALAASSGELDSSGQVTSDVESSGSQSEDAVNEALNINNGASKDENEAPKSNNEGQTQASEPQKEQSNTQAKEGSSSQADSATPKEETNTQTKDSSALKDQSESPNEGSNVQKEQSPPQKVEAVADINAETSPPVDNEANKVSNNKQASETTEYDDDTPPPDETLMAQTQSNYAADQQAEQALSYLTHTRQSGAYSSPTQRAVICKDTTQKISCPPEQKIRILNADYGDTGNVGCLKEANPVPSGPCRTPGAYETVKRECEGYEDCELSASNDVFGNACPDANKYLDVSYDCANNAVPYAPPAPAYSQASYQSAPQYVNPLPPPVSYAPAPYHAPPPPAYAPAMGLPNLLPQSPYVAPDPCSPCNTCAQCSLPVCSPCGQSCQTLTCPPRIPAKLQPLWQQWNEKTADMSRMEMAALIISPLPKLSPTKAPAEATESSGAAEGSESGEPTADEDALYEASKRSEIQRVKPQKKSKKTALNAHKKAHKKNDSDQGFFRNSDLMVSSGDASSGSST